MLYIIYAGCKVWISAVFFFKSVNAYVWSTYHFVNVYKQT